jgi:hypothetical protein
MARQWRLLLPEGADRLAVHDVEWPTRILAMPCATRAANDAVPVETRLLPAAGFEMSLRRRCPVPVYPGY